MGEGLPTFGYKEVVAILTSAFAVAPAKAGTFASRIAQLQKLGLPRGTNTGRGRPARYESWQLCELQFYLDLLQAGATPALIAGRFSGLGFLEIDGAGRYAETCAAEGVSYIVYVRLNALEHFHSKSETARENDASFTEFSAGYNVAGVIERADGKVGIVIDLAARFAVLKRAIFDIKLDLATIKLFNHLPHEGDEVRLFIAEQARK